MKVEQKGHTTIIKDTKGNFANFIAKVEEQFNTFKEKNLIIDVSHNENLAITEFSLAKGLVEKYKKEKKTLVLVAENIDFNKTPANLLVVPTILEAHDIIEMEEIERDLGF
jgi:hypothetical protein